jgi:hypothetical protein
MNKELETHIQQMADKQAYSPLGRSRRAYTKGIKDADAVGFAEWCDENYHKDNNTLWFNRYDNEPKGFSIEELYLTYLKTKTK